MGLFFATLAFRLPGDAALGFVALATGYVFYYWGFRCPRCRASTLTIDGGFFSPAFAPIWTPRACRKCNLSFSDRTFWSDDPEKLRSEWCVHLADAEVAREELSLQDSPRLALWPASRPYLLVAVALSVACLVLALIGSGASERVWRLTTGLGILVVDFSLLFTLAVWQARVRGQFETWLLGLGVVCAILTGSGAMFFDGPTPYALMCAGAGGTCACVAMIFYRLLWVDQYPVTQGPSRPAVPPPPDVHRP